MMHLLRKYDVARFARCDAMRSKARAEGVHHRRSLHHARRAHRVPERNASLKKAPCLCKMLFSGASEGNRTPDLLITKVVRHP